MEELNIIKASAGSGKTHNLTGAVLLQLFKHHQPDYFRHILAVTFTNKATEEMKSRLIRELYRLATGQHSDHLAMLEKIGYKGEKLVNKAGLLLKTLLHEYSWFSIETIDSFFQRVIRSFTRELGIPGNYVIELDTDAVLEYAVDELIDSLGEDKDLLDWLLTYTRNKIGEGRSWDFREDMLKLGKELFKERFSVHSEILQEVLGDRDKMRAFRDELEAIKKRFDQHCQKIGRQACSLIERQALTDADFFNKRNGAYKIFRNLASGEFLTSKGELFTSLTVIGKLLKDPQNWGAKDSGRKEDVAQLADQQLLSLLQQVVEYANGEYALYASAQTLSHNLYTLGIILDLADKIRQYRLEKNAFILSDSPRLIDRLINHNDTPFIYEKMGNRYENYFIDEFQDTSRLQWKNFKPLISNSVSQGKKCALVGDVKQSIYRWRNGEWEILAHEIFHDFPADILKVTKLDTNWRSCERLVAFNSAFFSEAVGAVKNELRADFAEAASSFEDKLEILSDVYSDVGQKMPLNKQQKNKGNILFRFFSGSGIKKDREYLREDLIDSLNKVLSLKYKLSDIAIIVRDGKEGKQIANFLLEAQSGKKFISDVRFISDESLLLSASETVALLIAALRYLHNKDEKLYLAELLAAFRRLKAEDEDFPEEKILAWVPLATGESTGKDLLSADFLEAIPELKLLPLYDLVERLLILFGLSNRDHELAYVHAFLDMVHEYVRTERGSVDKFLEYWDEKGFKKSVPAADSQEAIRIMTIHKSKGLEFPVVILPCADWTFDQKANSTFWVNVPERISDKVPVFPVNYSKALKNTVFADEYYTEKYRSWVDNLNLLYVAMTRAIETLVVFPVYREADNKTKGLGTVGDLLYRVLLEREDGFYAPWYSEEDQTLTIGFDEDCEIKEDSEKSEKIIRAGKSRPAMERLFFSYSGYEYFSESYSAITKSKLRGSLLHNILASMITNDDLEPEIASAVLRGKLTAEEGELLKQHVITCMKEPEVASWFDGSAMVINESEILLPEGKVRRPDRIVAWKDRVHVIDYKFGSEKNETRHRDQVDEYKKVLMRMGYPGVEGFLWYIDLNEVIRI